MCRCTHSREEQTGKAHLQIPVDSAKTHSDGSVTQQAVTVSHNNPTPNVGMNRVQEEHAPGHSGLHFPDNKQDKVSTGYVGGVTAVRDPAKNAKSTNMLGDGTVPKPATDHLKHLQGKKSWMMTLRTCTNSPLTQNTAALPVNEEEGDKHIPLALTWYMRISSWCSSNVSPLVNYCMICNAIAMMVSPCCHQT
jgi:hypothetical protein